MHRPRHQQISGGSGIFEVVGGEKKMPRKGRVVTLGGSLISSYATAVAQYQLEQTRLAPVFAFPAPEQYRIRVDYLYKQHVFIYDDAVKLAYLCPTIHVI